MGADDDAESFRLRILAYGLTAWHENTGSLARLSIDPLPHQIHLVHQILKSGNLNWLVADDVGLGKTVEVGMLISALKQRGVCRRILLVTPPGLVRQWKEEMHEKFGLSDFRIYGEDFTVRTARDWKLYDHVIGSMDTLKHESHLANVMQSGAWDLIVFDEAHRLSRSQFGMKLESSERYQLARRLRDMTESVLLLSATPHQGKQDKFQALLELIRPTRRDEIRMLSLNPQLLAEMVIRNNKADVIDASGNYIFQGKVTRVVSVPAQPEAEVFDKALQAYLRKGYAAGAQISGANGRAVGFVMTVYRKLAASSVAAIEGALERRLNRIRDPQMPAPEAGMQECPDDRYLGEWEERSADTGKEFFAGEIALLSTTLELARALKKNDGKLAAFIYELLRQVFEANPAEKVLIFTEYRATQDYIAAALRGHKGDGSVSLIHGGMNPDERGAAIAHFEAQGQFLISTEAGAEGINLQRHCHVMVNYDLPWNPMRLVQRVGRLYRYGQKQKVVVFNLHAPQTFDAQILETLYSRINQVVADMAQVGNEFREGLREDILGQVADMVDVDDILQEAITAGGARTNARIDEALRNACEATSKQQELLGHASGFDAKSAMGELALTKEHVRAFVIGMCRKLGITVTAELHSGNVLELVLPDEICQELKRRASHLRIAFERSMPGATASAEVIDINSPLFRLLLRKAKAISGGGLYAPIAGLNADAAIAFMLYWQTDAGNRMREEFAVALVSDNGSARLNPDELTHWMLQDQQSSRGVPERECAERLLSQAEAAADERLAKISSEGLHPEGVSLVACASLAGDLRARQTEKYANSAINQQSE
ncbi:MAG TPA: helicase-related protein [Burkholderiaceae bacterium]|nr:helicase-related protein [Burkholderiaceae bacterium]